MSGKIFISYRREDEPGFALALFVSLDQSFSAERLFMDVEGGIKAGEDFTRVLHRQVSECDVMLALIGRSWLKATDENGRRRLDNEHDFVRIEIESALKLGKLIIPVLLHKAEIPSANALPQSLQPLTHRNAAMLTQQRFKADAQGLITEIKKALAEVEQARHNARRVLIIRPFGVKVDRSGNQIDFDLVHQDLVEPALNGFGLESGRQLDISTLDVDGQRQDILPVLMTANLAVVDVSIDYANVFYHLGTRFASGDKKTILLRSTDATAAFDVYGERYVNYVRHNPAASVTALTQAIRQTLDPGEIE